MQESLAEAFEAMRRRHDRLLEHHALLERKFERIQSENARLAAVVLSETGVGCVPHRQGDDENPERGTNLGQREPVMLRRTSSSITSPTKTGPLDRGWGMIRSLVQGSVALAAPSTPGPPADGWPAQETENGSGDRQRLLQSAPLSVAPSISPAHNAARQHVLMTDLWPKVRSYFDECMQRSPSTTPPTIAEPAAANCRAVGRARHLGYRPAKMARPCGRVAWTQNRWLGRGCTRSLRRCRPTLCLRIRR